MAMSLEAMYQAGRGGPPATSDLMVMSITKISSQSYQATISVPIAITAALCGQRDVHIKLLETTCKCTVAIPTSLSRTDIKPYLNFVLTGDKLSVECGVRGLQWMINNAPQRALNELSDDELKRICGLSNSNVNVPAVNKSKKSEPTTAPNVTSVSKAKPSPPDKAKAAASPAMKKQESNKPVPPAHPSTNATVNTAEVMRPCTKHFGFAKPFTCVKGAQCDFAHTADQLIPSRQALRQQADEKRIEQSKQQFENSTVEYVPILTSTYQPSLVTVDKGISLAVVPLILNTPMLIRLFKTQRIKALAANNNDVIINTRLSNIQIGQLQSQCPYYQVIISGKTKDVESCMAGLYRAYASIIQSQHDHPEAESQEEERGKTTERIEGQTREPRVDSSATTKQQPQQPTKNPISSTPPALIFPCKRHFGVTAPFTCKYGDKCKFAHTLQHIIPPFDVMTHNGEQMNDHERTSIPVITEQYKPACWSTDDATVMAIIPLSLNPTALQQFFQGPSLSVIAKACKGVSCIDPRSWEKRLKADSESAASDGAGLYYQILITARDKQSIVKCAKLIYTEWHTLATQINVANVDSPKTRVVEPANNAVHHRPVAASSRSDPLGEMGETTPHFSVLPSPPAPVSMPVATEPLPPMYDDIYKPTKDLPEDIREEGQPALHVQPPHSPVQAPPSPSLSSPLSDAASAVAPAPPTSTTSTSASPQLKKIESCTASGPTIRTELRDAIARRCVYVTGEKLEIIYLMSDDFKTASTINSGVWIGVTTHRVFKLERGECDMVLLSNVSHARYSKAGFLRWDHIVCELKQGGEERFGIFNSKAGLYITDYINTKLSTSTTM